MSENDALPPHVRITETAIWNYQRALLIRTAVNLELADIIGTSTLSLDALTDHLGAHSRNLYRLMRALCSIGLFREEPEREFSTTALGAALRRDAPGAARAAITMMYIDASRQAWDRIEQSVLTGESAFEAANGEAFFDYLQQRPDEAALFSETMVNLSNTEPPAVAEACDYSRFGTIVDVGGATGNLLATILERYSEPVGILFDLPHVLESAPALLAARGVSARVELRTGDFFREVPTGGDLYLLSHIVHDWSGDKAGAILRRVREAMPAHARLQLVEMVIGDTNQPTMGTILDMSMLVYTHGEERTLGEYRDLLAANGFALEQVVPTASNASIIEAKPV